MDTSVLVDSGCHHLRGLSAMVDRDEWQESVKGICAVDMP